MSSSAQGSLDAVRELLTRDVQRTKGSTIIGLVIIVGVFTIASCNPTPAQPTRLAAGLFGKLVLVDNCFRVISGYSDDSVLLIWPPIFDVRMDRDTVNIFDTLTQDKVVWHIGEQVTLGGGEVYGINDGERPLFSANCPGPYWLVGFVTPLVTPAVK